MKKLTGRQLYDKATDGQVRHNYRGSIPPAWAFVHWSEQAFWRGLADEAERALRAAEA